MSDTLAIAIAYFNEEARQELRVARAYTMRDLRDLAGGLPGVIADDVRGMLDQIDKGDFTCDSSKPATAA